MKKYLPWLFLLLSVSCSSGGGLEPIVIDLSKPKTKNSPTPTPAAPSVVAAPAAASRAPAPSPTPTPQPKADEVAAAPATPVPAAATAATGIASTASTTSAPSTGALSPSDPARTVDARVDAFNRRDARGLVELYAPDARIYDPPDRVRDAGIDGIRAALERELAASPGGPVAVRDRIIQGAFVVERESRGGTSALVIYEVRAGRIVNVWMLR